MGFQTQDPTSTGIMITLGGSSGVAGTTGNISVATGPSNNMAGVVATPTTGISLANPVVIIVLVALAFVVFR
jgi:hypothetical protein